MPRAFLCDFDGTMAPDVGAALAHRFGVGSDREWDEALARWRSGAIGSRELTRFECERMVATRDQATSFVRSFGVDREFAPFAREVLAGGDAVEVASEGFDFYIADLLARAGLSDLPWTANRARFEGATISPEFPHADPACPGCGNCKGRHVRRWQAQGYRVVLVGDGYSDRCGALAADEVWARGSLLEWCAEQGIAARPFEGFASLRKAVSA